ncbi:hypothetical protein [Actinacidiphila oryziradicis]|uniref:hypothetical protein n=1 Tax=Actinacidiphila oryziradicis TaxID=2571141 RepID=UPI002AFDDFAA|nr:hypothetical protein [Actinacidiphila oryziradicis]
MQEFGESAQPRSLVERRVARVQYMARGVVDVQQDRVETVVRRLGIQAVGVADIAKKPSAAWTAGVLGRRSWSRWTG